MSSTSHVRQFPPGTVKEAVPLQEAKDRDFFQWLDPPKVKRSPDTPPYYRDSHIIKVRANATTAATIGDTTFVVLVGEPDDAGDYQFVDILEGQGILPAEATEDEWYLDPPIDVHGRRTKRAVQTLTIGTGLEGFVVEVLYS